MGETIETYKHDGLTVAICQDEHAESPRDTFDHVGRMACTQKCYGLVGDDAKKLGWTFNPNNFDGWDEVEKHLIDEEGALVVLPLYLYDHSGITMATKPFSCRWDSGQVGFIYATKAAAKENWPELQGEELVKAVTACLEAEVAEYDAYLRGDVYGYIITNHANETVDSVWGYYGMEAVKDAADDSVRFYAKEHNLKVQVAAEAIEAARVAVADYIGGTPAVTLRRALDLLAKAEGVGA